ncbi:hypothetical protein QF041_000446 [Paenibacillus sp. W2I17]|nr:hypothetical protein [Paenibacillus sp. W2I17]
MNHTYKVLSINKIDDNYIPISYNIYGVLFNLLTIIIYWELYYINT